VTYPVTYFKKQYFSPFPAGSLTTPTEECEMERWSEGAMEREGEGASEYEGEGESERARVKGRE